MKKLIFLGFVFSVIACQVQDKLTNGIITKPSEPENPGSPDEHSPPDEPSEPTPPDNSVQTSKSEWINLVRRKSNNIFTFDRSGNAIDDSSSRIRYKFCSMAKGQNKAIYNAPNQGYIGYGLKERTLLMFMHNNYAGSYWSSSNDVSFDTNSPNVHVSYMTLHISLWTNTTTKGQAWIQKYKDKTLTSQQNNAKQFTINSDGHIVEQGQSNPTYYFSYVDDLENVYFYYDSLDTDEIFHGAVIKDNMLTWHSLKPGFYGNSKRDWYNVSDVIFDASLPLVHTENFIIN